jgi:hypothetical protein
MMSDKFSCCFKKKYECVMNRCALRFKVCNDEIPKALVLEGECELLTLERYL